MSRGVLIFSITLVALIAVRTVALFRAPMNATWSGPVAYDPDSPNIETNDSLLSEKGIKLIGAVVVSGVTLPIALYAIIKARTNDKSREWAIGAVGTILGFWLNI